MRLRLSLLFLVGLVSIWVVSVAAQQWQYAGTITSDASAGETALTVEMERPVQVGRLILIESRDGLVRETYEVRHVYGHYIILESTLLMPYVSGSKIFQ